MLEVVAIIIFISESKLNAIFLLYIDRICPEIGT